MVRPTQQRINEDANRSQTCVIFRHKAAIIFSVWLYSDPRPTYYFLCESHALHKLNKLLIIWWWLDFAIYHHITTLWVSEKVFNLQRVRAKSKWSMKGYLHNSRVIWGVSDRATFVCLKLTDTMMKRWWVKIKENTHQFSSFLSLQTHTNIHQRLCIMD